MARGRLIIHGSQEELDMFEPIYNTRLRLQHGAASSRFQLPDPPAPSVDESEHESGDEDEDRAISNTQEGNGADHHVETGSCNWRRDDEEDEDIVPHSEEERVGSANNDSTRLQGNGSETPASPEAPESDTDTDSDSDSDS